MSGHTCRDATNTSIDRQKIDYSYRFHFDGHDSIAEKVGMCECVFFFFSFFLRSAIYHCDSLLKSIAGEFGFVCRSVYLGQLGILFVLEDIVRVNDTAQEYW